MRVFRPALRLIALAFLAFTAQPVFSQSITPGSESDQRLRIAQLNGLLDPSWSFTVLPAYRTNHLIATSDSLLPSFTAIRRSPRKTFWIVPAPVVVQTFHNTRHPWGWNDRGVWQQHGRTNSYRAGLRAGAGPLEIQFQPELVWHENAKYDTTRGVVYLFSLWRTRQQRIDLPIRLEQTSYTRLWAGQSYARINVGAFHAGLSTENLWFGPGQHFSLLMSNNAPGFLHGFIGTQRPVQTPVGSFEARFITGRLENSDQYKYRRKDQWRLVGAAVVAWQPVFLPGLSLGFVQTRQTDEEDLEKGYRPYLPMPWLFNKNPRTVRTNPVNDRISDDQFSLFSRWVFPESGAEVYGELASSLDTLRKRDLILYPEQSSAWILGFRKDVLPSKKRSLLFGLEILKMEKTITRTSNTVPDWYGHYSVNDGWTHYGQMLGVGLPQNSNARVATIQYVDTRTAIGLKVQHMVYNNTLYYEIFKNNRWRHWVDLNAGFSASHRFRHVTVGMEFTRVQTYNRHWLRDNDHMNLNAMFFLQAGI